jgi:hypothetical protein
VLFVTTCSSRAAEKESDFDFVVKGRGFKPRRKSCEMNVGFLEAAKKSGIVHDREGHEFYSCRKSNKIIPALATAGLWPRAK